MLTVEETRALVQQAMEEMKQEESDWIQDSLEIIDEEIEKAASEGRRKLTVGFFTRDCMGHYMDVTLSPPVHYQGQPYHGEELLDIIGDIYEGEGYQVSYFPDLLGWLHNLLGKNDTGSHVNVGLGSRGTELFYEITISW